jgi:tetratricopeptide (TPR) repeat protein
VIVTTAALVAGGPPRAGLPGAGGTIAVAIAADAIAADADDPCVDPLQQLPDRLRGRYVTAERLLLAEEAESAADYVELMLVEAPRSVAVLELAARVFKAMDEPERLASALETVAELCPEREVDLSGGAARAGPLEAPRALYRRFLAAGAGDEREALLARAIEAYERFTDGEGDGDEDGDADRPVAVEAHHTLAVLYTYAGRPASAQRAYRWLERHDALTAAEVPEFLRVLRSLGHAGAGGRDLLEEGEELLDGWRTRLEGAPRAQAERHLGFLALHVERPAVALTAFTDAVEADPEDTEAHYGLAVALDLTARRLEGAGDRDGARRLREQALAHARRAVSHPRYGEAARALIARLQFD